MGNIENLKPYEEYKDSGVEWLGQVPARWVLSKGSREVVLRGGYSFNSDKFTDGTSGVPIVKIGDVITQKPSTFSSEMPPSSFLVFKNEIVLGMSGSDIFNLAIWKEEEAYLNQRVCVVKSKDLERLDANFLFYSLVPIIDRAIYDTKSTTLKNLSNADIFSFRLLVPPLPTQQRIVEFLDAETGRVDTLVSELEAMITLLREERKVLISDTVTRGIAGEHTEYKNSGVDWLGEIPNGWEVQKISRIAKFFTGGTPPTEQKEYFDGEESWASIADLKNGVLRDTHKKLSQKGVNRARIILSPVGSLLYSFKLSVGKVAITTFPTYTNEAIATFLPSDKILTKYAFYVYPIFLIKNAKKNIYNADLLNADLINQARLPLPSTEEQTRIVTFLDSETSKIDVLIAEATSAITLLKEERKVLISDIVTGKLEV